MHLSKQEVIRIFLFCKKLRKIVKCTDTLGKNRRRIEPLAYYYQAVMIETSSAFSLTQDLSVCLFAASSLFHLIVCAKQTQIIRKEACTDVLANRFSGIQRIPNLCLLISSLSGATRNSVGMARLAGTILS